jgi:hypothetical protein
MTPRLTIRRAGNHAGGKRYEDQSPAALMDRITANVHRDANGCWLWQGTVNSRGYGQIGVRDGGTDRRGNVRCVSRSVHRLVLEIATGQPLVGAEMACHRCDVKRCCNPAHLYRGDAFTNARDRRDAMARARAMRAAA